MDITPFGPDDVAELEAWADLANAARAQDAPWERTVTAKMAAAQFRHGWDGEPSTPYLARRDGRVVGAGTIGTSERDNLHLAWLDVKVHPEHRRRGHGSAILRVLLDEARRRGRTSAGIGAWESDAADAFAKRHGFERKLASINRRQVMADIDWAELDRRYDEAVAHATGYTLERWTSPTPDDRLDELAAMASAINDAPRDDLDMEDEVFTAERMKAYETAVTGHDERLYRVVARHVPSDSLAAQTVVAVSAEEPTWGEQHDTSVMRTHRGHRLGLLLKLEMMRWVHEVEPQVETIDTWNAESNDHMIGVNEILGYRIMGREYAYQRAL